MYLPPSRLAGVVPVERIMGIEDQIAGFRTRAEDFSGRLDALRRAL